MRRYHKPEQIKFEATRYDDQGHVSEKISTKFTGELVLSGGDSIETGLLEQFKAFASALGYPASCVDRIAYLSQREQDDWLASTSNSSIKLSTTMEILKATDQELAEHLTSPDSTTRAIAAQVANNRAKRELENTTIEE